MSSKKVSLKEFNTMVAKMVKEELDVALKEQEGADDSAEDKLHPSIASVRDKEKMAGWLMRQYFDPNKHKDRVWYKPSVDESNVLEFVSDVKNNFPLTPKETSDLWKLKKSLGSSLKNISKELDDYKEEDDDSGKVKYQTGETTLQKIGDELGGLSPTAINKLAGASMDKVKRLTKGVAPWDMDSDDWENVSEKIMAARVKVAEDFAKALKGSKGNVESFLKDLVDQKVITNWDVENMSEKEMEELFYLTARSEEQIKYTLLGDIEKDNNIFKSFQSAVSGKIFPHGSRGRPRKDDASNTAD
jgi:BMFP domain-containing protein YqiC